MLTLVSFRNASSPSLPSDVASSRIRLASVSRDGYIAVSRYVCFEGSKGRVDGMKDGRFCATRSGPRISAGSGVELWKGSSGGGVGRRVGFIVGLVL